MEDRVYFRNHLNTKGIIPVSDTLQAITLAGADSASTAFTELPTDGTAYRQGIKFTLSPSREVFPCRMHGNPESISANVRFYHTLCALRSIVAGHGVNSNDC